MISFSSLTFRNSLTRPLTSDEVDSNFSLLSDLLELVSKSLSVTPYVLLIPSVDDEQYRKLVTFWEFGSFIVYFNDSRFNFDYDSDASSFVMNDEDSDFEFDFSDYFYFSENYLYFKAYSDLPIEHELKFAFSSPVSIEPDLIETLNV